MNARLRPILLIAAVASALPASQALGQPVPQGPPFLVNSYANRFVWYPQAAMTPTGEFVIAWTQRYRDGSFDGVFARRYDASGNPLGSDFQVNTTTLSDQWSPRLAMNSAGEFLVVWNSCTTACSESDIFGRRYDASGNALGPEFLINAYTTSRQE